MNDQLILPGVGRDTTRGEIIKLACLAVGGQGGGVLGNWIEHVARNQGYACQATSVAGVAQRTGSTIYYLEMAQAGAALPVFSLAPNAGDVDIVVGAELMEVGRAILRGFVTPDRTVLIGSTHRVVSIAEKLVPGDGLIPPDEVLAAAGIAAHRLVLHDLERVAVDNGSVISASLFGALAGSGALPFPRAAFEDAIRGSGTGVEASLRAFAAAYELAQHGTAQTPVAAAPTTSFAPKVTGPMALTAEWSALIGRVAELPEPTRPIAEAGLAAVVDYQGVEYGRTYLDRLGGVAALDTAERGWELTREAAKYIARAMCYDDIIRVADLKTRGTRFQRVEDEIRPANDAVMRITEYMHPRAEELIGLFPASIGARWQDNSQRMARLDRWMDKGRRIPSNRLWGFVVLHFLGGLRGWRLKTLRHAQEVAHLERWLLLSGECAATDYALGVEILRCRRLIKGYSDTHARGLSKYDRVTGALDLLRGRKDAADWIRRLTTAALADEEGLALDGVVRTIRSF